MSTRLLSTGPGAKGQGGRGTVQQRHHGAAACGSGAIQPLPRAWGWPGKEFNSHEIERRHTDSPAREGHGPSSLTARPTWEQVTGMQVGREEGGCACMRERAAGCRLARLAPHLQQLTPPLVCNNHRTRGRARGRRGRRRWRRRRRRRCHTPRVPFAACDRHGCRPAPQPGERQGAEVKGDPSLRGARSSASRKPPRVI